MSDEIRRLGTLVGEFDYPFHPHSGFLQNYKKVSFILFHFISFTCVLLKVHEFDFHLLKFPFL